MERFNIYEELIQSLSNIKGYNHNRNELDERCSNAILYSTVTVTRIDQLNLNAAYWWKNIRNPVLFNNHGIQSICNDMKDSNINPIFIEISSHPVLSSTTIECFQEFKQLHKLSSIQIPITIYSLKRKENEQQTILSSLCSLLSYFGSHLIDWQRFFNSHIYGQLLQKIIQYQHQLFLLLIHYQIIHLITKYTGINQKIQFFSRRAIKKKHHPLLGCRLWHNETQTPKWKNVFAMNKDSMHLSYLLDHKIHGDILFPASAFIELVISAINQLFQYVSSEQQSITLQNIQFLSGLHLDNDDTIQIETVIIMPFKEFFIYSRRKPPNDSVHLAGISGNEIKITFSDENSLHKYSSKEWSLHCSDLINLKIDASLISSMYDIQSILNRLLLSNNTNSTIIAENENDIENLYKYFSECGLTFGPQFRSIKKII
ncbi:unnamed protein product [Rotaria sp. Silwood1]|nr:unnamed protein product [Rotaria sp. Silwood1]CAF1620708.1 unnamed protein product [Rotaria sp. Silwood1]CAF3815644.1 unnamed protein product [Rotaria sp. Silwood1]